MDYYIQLSLQSSKLMRVATLVSIVYLFVPTIRVLYTFLRRIQYLRSFPKCEDHSLLGNLKLLISSALVGDFVRDQTAKLAREGVVAIWIGWYPIIACTDYRFAEAILSKPNVVRNGQLYWDGFRDGLITSNGAKWRARRRMIEPFFTTKSMSTYTPVMNETFNKMISDMEDKQIHSIDMADYIHKTSLDIILAATMTIPIEAEKQHKEHLIEGISSILKMFTVHNLIPLMWFDWVFYQTQIGKLAKTFEERSDRLIEHQIAQRFARRSTKIIESTEKETKRDFIDLLLNHYDPNTSNTIDMDGIKEEILTMIIAGHDTIADALRWTLFLLGNNLECQDKLYNEIVLNNANGENHDNNTEDINRLTYLDQCIKESMRLYPPVPLTIRKLTFDSGVGKFMIPKETYVILSIYTIHRDPKVWSNPDFFDPDRFSSERFAGIPKYAYIPFGQGKRICIGQRFAMIEMKLFLVKFIRKYRFVATQSVDQAKFDIAITLKPRAPLVIKLTPRCDNSNENENRI